MTRPVDPEERAARFISLEVHESTHDRLVWGMRQNRDKAVAGVPEWEKLRNLASQIKEHTLTHLDHYLEQFEAHIAAGTQHVGRINEQDVAGLEFLEDRDAIQAFLTRKWSKELDYRLIKELWGFRENRVAVRFVYEWHDDSCNWYRSYGNELWEFDADGLMRRRIASEDMSLTIARGASP